MYYFTISYLLFSCLFWYVSSHSSEELSVPYVNVLDDIPSMKNFTTVPPTTKLGGSFPDDYWRLYLGTDASGSWYTYVPTGGSSISQLSDQFQELHTTVNHMTFLLRSQLGDLATIFDIAADRISSRLPSPAALFTLNRQVEHILANKCPCVNQPETTTPFSVPTLSPEFVNTFIDQNSQIESLYNTLTKNLIHLEGRVHALNNVRETLQVAYETGQITLTELIKIQEDLRKTINKLSEDIGFLEGKLDQNTWLSYISAGVTVTVSIIATVMGIGCCGISKRSEELTNMLADDKIAHTHAVRVKKGRLEVERLMRGYKDGSLIFQPQITHQYYKNATSNSYCVSAVYECPLQTVQNIHTAYTPSLRNHFKSDGYVTSDICHFTYVGTDELKFSSIIERFGVFGSTMPQAELQLNTMMNSLNERARKDYSADRVVQCLFSDFTAVSMLDDINMNFPDFEATLEFDKRHTFYTTGMKLIGVILVKNQKIVGTRVPTDGGTIRMELFDPIIASISGCGRSCHCPIQSFMEGILNSSEDPAVKAHLAIREV